MMNLSVPNRETKCAVVAHATNSSLGGHIRVFTRDKVRLLTFLTLLVTIAGFLGESHWLLELTSHFRLQYVGAAFLCWLLLLGFRDWRWSFMGLLGVVLNGAVILPFYLDRPRELDASGTKLRVMLSNVLTSNANSAGLLAMTQDEAPDILVLQEVDDRWAEALKELDRLYPYSKIIPRNDNFGLGLWSRHPLVSAEEVILSELEVPSIRAEIEISGKVISILATHPVPPISKEGLEHRNAQLSATATLIRQLSTPAILIGDLNVTMWSPYYAKLVRDTGLVNSREGFGVLPTWPTQLPILKIPLDHCLVSRSINVLGVRTGREIGSDHLPLIVDCAVPKQ